MTTAAAPVLTVHDLHVVFEREDATPVRAVHGVSFELRAGEILGVLGESGSGKTTLGRCIAGLLPPSAGRLEFADGYAGSVQMVFQESATALDPRLPIWRSVAEAASGGRSTGRRWLPRALEELRRVGLTRDQALKLPRELSGGQRQRAGIARALASGARILVCDEAVSALDVSVRARVLNLIAALRRETGASFVFISHDLGVVAHLADRILVMRDGGIVEQGATRDLVEHPGDPYTRHLLDAVPDLEPCSA
ncbi:MAG: ABC transporter ATP-binding protein [Lautropia sp.]